MSETAEKVYFDKGNVQVTNARFVNGSNTYAMRNVSAVSQKLVSPNLKAPAIILVIGLLLAAGSVWVFAVPAILLGGLIILTSKSKHTVVLTTSGGDLSALESPDVKLITEVVAALNQSIIYRG